MKMRQLPSLVLSLALQVLPVAKVAQTALPAAPSSFAIVFQWLAGAAALLGGYNAVSAASAAVAGVANTSPSGPVTQTATGTVNTAFSYRIIVTNPGSDTRNFYYNAKPLPPGLTINTNTGGNGWITGTPTVAGTYAVTVSSGYKSQLVSKAITIQIAEGASPPAITNQPQGQIARAGSSVALSVAASGSSLAYQWFFNDASLEGATNALLALDNVTTDSSGQYYAAVSNSLGTATSDVVRLLVVPAPSHGNAPAFALAKVNEAQADLGFTALAGYRYLIEYADDLLATNWITLTNLAPAYTNADISLPQSLADAPQRYYRAIVSVD